MAVIGNGATCVFEAARAVQCASNWVIDGPKNVFANVDPLSDLMKLIQRINDIFKPYLELIPLQQISECFSHITDFVNARNFIGRISDIVSGKAAWDKPFTDDFPDLLKLASKCAYLIGDFAQTAKWLSSINVLGAWVKDSTAQLVSWGKEFKILKGIGDFSCITGSLLNMADTIRLIVQEARRDGYIRGGYINFSLAVDHVVDIAYDAAKIAASVLSNIPGINALFTLISLSVASTLSLGKFMKKTYWHEAQPALPPPSQGSEEVMEILSPPIQETESGDDEAEQPEAAVRVESQEVQPAPAPAPLPPVVVGQPQTV